VNSHSAESAFETVTNRHFMLKGDLAGMLSAARDSKRSPETGDLLVQIKLVAGACNQRYLQLWRAAA